MNDKYAVMIPAFPLFRGFTLDGAHMLLDSGEVKELSPGAMLIDEGDASTFVILILTRQLEVFVARHGCDLVLNEAGPGTILGELAVLCGIARSASVRAIAETAILEWTAATFRSLLLRNVFLSERIFRESLRTLIEKEHSLIESLVCSQGASRNT